jgi:ATP-dependent DNA helicase RecG
MELAGPDVLRRLQELDESVEIEAKLGTAVGNSAMETVSAFSNEPSRGGGYILFGVSKVASADEDSEQRYEAVGVPEPDNLGSDLVSKCASMLNEVVRPEIEPFTDSATGKVLVCAFIREAQDHQKPIYIQKLGVQRGAFRRISGHDVHCTDDDLEVLYRRTGTGTYDETVVHGSTFDDLDPDAFDAYRRMRSDREAPELEYSNLELSRSIVAVKQTGTTADPIWTPTICGLMLFGRRTALRQFFPMFRIEYIRVQSTLWVEDPESRFDTVEVLEPLLFAIPRVIQNAVADVPRSFKITSGNVERQETPLLPALALREAIVNAVMHRSYRTRQPLQIIKYSDRIEIRNPGASLVPEDRLGEPGSLSRNEKIAMILHETKLAENKGSGINAMRRSIENAGVVPPSFRSDRERDEFVATFRMQHFLDSDDLGWLSRFKSFRLDEDQAKSLVFVRRYGSISNADYRALNHVDTLTASGRLRDLKSRELLVPHGAGSGTTYGPGAAFLNPTAHQRRTAPRKSSGRLFRRDRESLLALLPVALRPTVASIQKPTPANELDTMVLGILTAVPLSGGELSILLDRSRVGALKSVSRLRARGLVQPTLPHDLKSPFQTYAAVTETSEIDLASERGTLLEMVKPLPRTAL